MLVFGVLEIQGLAALAKGSGSRVWGCKASGFGI